jgi:hypothetical protein
MTIRWRALLAPVAALLLTALSSAAQVEETAPGTTTIDPTSSDTTTADSATTSLADDLAQVRLQITDAEQELARYEGGLIKGLIQARLAILRLSEAMLAQKELATKTGAAFAFTLPVALTDAKRAQDLLGDITAAEEELSRLEQEAAKYGGGLVQALAESNVAMQRQTVAMLKQAYYVAHYGLYQPAPAPSPDIPGSSTEESASSRASIGFSATVI